MMGREIRRVPLGWQHPKKPNGDFQPLYDKSYSEEAEEWIAELLAWQNNTHDGKKSDTTCKYYWEYAGNPPDEKYCRPDFTEAPTCFQIYETVSEGTPTSPVFETKEQMRVWLIEQGYSQRAAEEFIRTGWAPSMLAVGGKGIFTDIHACGEFGTKGEPK